jgi:hypothetical protein
VTKMSRDSAPTRSRVACPSRAALWLRGSLAVNGAVFVLRGTLNVVAPNSFYLPPDPPRYAEDVVRLLGVTYLAVALAQLQAAWRGDDSAVRGMAAASMVFAGGAATVAASSAGSRATRFDRVRRGSAVENAALCVAYGALIARARSAAASHLPGAEQQLGADGHEGGAP